MKQNRILSIVATAIALCFTLSTQAYAAAHVWYTAYSSNGFWNATLASISENATFVNTNNESITQFTVDPSAPAIYGFNYGTNDDFDIAYTLTLTQKNSQPQANSQFTSKACVFVVTATSPAHPDIQTLSYNGAKCVADKATNSFYVE